MRISYFIFICWGTSLGTSYQHLILAYLFQFDIRKVTYHIWKDIKLWVANFINQLLSNRCLGYKSSSIWGLGYNKLPISRTFSDWETNIVPEMIREICTMRDKNVFAQPGYYKLLSPLYFYSLVMWLARWLRISTCSCSFQSGIDTNTDEKLQKYEIINKKLILYAVKNNKSFLSQIKACRMFWRRNVSLPINLFWISKLTYSYF